MKHYIFLYIGTILVMPVLDSLWIGVLAREFYKSRIDNLEFHIVPAILFYLMYVTGVVVFVSARATSLQSNLIYGAFFGFVAYATYDLTNMATLRGWSTLLAVADIAWGTFVTAIAASAGFLIAGFLERS